MLSDKISLLIEAAKAVGSSQLLGELEIIKQQSQSCCDTPIMLPLVGEFSSGKTTLLNALTNSKVHETATKPTTATIFEIHFGAPENYTEITKENGETITVSDVSLLKNNELEDTKVVTVFDTSTKVSPFTILVDTPGISSTNPKHQQTLVDFLPQADSILIVLDVQQQLTKSLTNFLKAASMSGIELNAVITKAETKSAAEVAAAKKYLEENCELPIKKVVAVSSHKNQLDELLQLLNEIESNKAEILNKSANLRIKRISEQLLGQIDEILNASRNDAELEAAIQEQNEKLRKIQHQLDRLTSNVQSEIEEVDRETIRKFEDQVSVRLSSLVNGKSNNYDNEAVSVINSTASIIIGEFRQKVMRILSEEASRPVKDGEISLSGIIGIDLSTIGVQGLSYNINLNNAGHEYDKWIKGGIIAVAAVGTLAAVASTGGAAAAAEGLMAVDTVADVADTISDVGSIVSNRKMTERIESAVKYGQTIENTNASGIGQGGIGKGMIDSIAGLIAEKTMSKPQRARAIRVYIDESLVPEFKMLLHQAETQVIDTLKDVLQELSRNSLEETTATLKKLQDDMRNNISTFEQKKCELRELKTKLLTL